MSPAWKLRSFGSYMALLRNRTDVSIGLGRSCMCIGLSMMERVSPETDAVYVGRAPDGNYSGHAGRPHRTMPVRKLMAVVQQAMQTNTYKKSRCTLNPHYVPPHNPSDKRHAVTITTEAEPSNTNTNTNTQKRDTNAPVHSHYTTTTPSPSPPSAPAGVLPSSQAAQSPAAAHVHDADAGEDSNNLIALGCSHVQAAVPAASTPRCSSSLPASACYGENEQDWTRVRGSSSSL